MSIISNAMEALRPGAVWSLVGDDVEWIKDENNNDIPNMEYITWDDERDFPTKYEWQGQVEIEKQKQDDLLYQFNRRKEFPPKDDLFDALYHREVNGDESYMTAYMEKVAAVKAKYPKPSES